MIVLERSRVRVAFAVLAARHRMARMLDFQNLHNNV